jgi:hypothetical protein
MEKEMLKIKEIEERLQREKEVERRKANIQQKYSL